MVQNSEHGVNNPPVLSPSVRVCYKNGWRQMWKHILELLVITIIFSFISFPSLPSKTQNIDSLSDFIALIPNVLTLFGFPCYISVDGSGESMGVRTIILDIFTLAYTLLIFLPIKYGVSFAYLKAARGDQLKVRHMFDVFENYLNAILANLLVVVIFGFGFVLLIVPGIIFACRLAFVSYLVVDRRMQAIEAVKESWRMTRGHVWRILLIGVLAIPIFIGGLICFGVGSIMAIMWIGLASASLYHMVNVSGEMSGPKVNY